MGNMKTAALAQAVINVTQGNTTFVLDATLPWTSTPAQTDPPPPQNVPPVANFTSTTNGLVATFADASSDADGTIVSRAWAFGDGGTSTQTNPVHTYTSAGTYNVSLTVTDDDGAPNTRTQQVTVAAIQPPPVLGIETTFDSQYPPSFTLRSETTGTRPVIKPARPSKGSGITTPDYLDSYHATRGFKLTNRATEASPNGGDHLRHEYSKRVVFNADNTRYIAQDAQGYWFLYDATTRARLLRTGTNGALPGLAGDCEPFFARDKPTKLWHTATNGGLQWVELDVETGVSTQLFTLAGKLPASMAQAGRSWFKGEGRPSDDGRYWGLMVETSNFAMLGMVMFDVVANAVVGYVATTQMPDHTMTSSLGNYMLLGYYDSRGVIAFPRTYQGSDLTAGRKLTYANVEHGDVALDAAGAEVYVQLDYASGSPTEGWIRSTRMSDGAVTKLPIPLYPVQGEAGGGHVSGIISGKHHGWVLVSLEGSSARDSSGHTVEPAPNERWCYDRVSAVELKATGRVLHICEHFSSGGSYFNEPQVSSNFDGTRIVFASAWNYRDGADSSQAESYMIALPSFAIPPSTAAAATA